MNKLKPFQSAALLSLALLVSMFAAPAAAQKREHLTPEEIDFVRDNQELDKRTEVFVKAAERRMLAITNPGEASKDKEKWGEVKGTRSQLLYDISKILDEAVVNIDGAAERSPQSPLLRKSLFKLSEAANRLVPQLGKLREGLQSEAESDNLERALAMAQEIVEAAKERGVNSEDLKTKAGKKGN
ncbi:MAG TPA: hypothetical protein VEX60_00810 [Pyrinomonadaceae bacterium]|nr:hypothetical protein [Pyrinomonadaceae bacterium]